MTTETHTVTRDPDEIVAEILRSREQGDDFFDVYAGDLVQALDFEHAKQFLIEGATPEQWAASITMTAAESALEYVPFALSKIRDHRGLSAGRSVDHFAAWAWLLGWELPREPWGQYGAPVVYSFLEHFGWLELWPADDPELERMRQGLPCTPDCPSGCGIGEARVIWA